MNKLSTILSFDGFFIDGNIEYISSSFFNGLVEFNKITGELIRIRRFDDGSLLSQLLHHKIIKFENKLYFIPNFSYRLHVLDLYTNEITYITIKKNDWTVHRCNDYLVVDDVLWLFSSYVNNGVISVDLRTQRVSYFDDIFIDLKEYVKNSEEPMFWSEFYKEGNKAFGVIYKSGYVVEIDVKRLNVNIHFIGDKYNFCGVIKQNNTLYLTQTDSFNIVEYKLDTAETRVINCGHNKEQKIMQEITFSNIISYKDFGIIIPNYGKDILRIQDGVITKWSHLPSDFMDIQYDSRKMWKRFYNYEIVNEILFLYPNRANMLVSINLTTGLVKGHQYKLPKEWEQERFYREYICGYIRDCYGNNDVLVENERVGLQEWMGYFI